MSAAIITRITSSGSPAHVKRTVLVARSSFTIGCQPGGEKFCCGWMPGALTNGRLFQNYDTIVDPGPCSWQ